MGVGAGVDSAVGVAIGGGAGVGVLPPAQATAIRAASSRHGRNRIFNGRMGVFRYGLVLYQNGCYGNRNGCIVLYIILDRVGESCKRVGEREGDVEW